MNNTDKAVSVKILNQPELLLVPLNILTPEEIDRLVWAEKERRIRENLHE